MVKCPQCKKEYEPVLGQRLTDNLIQDEFPNAKPWEREQLQSGICSDKCWDEWLGITDKSIPSGVENPIQCNHKYEPYEINDEGSEMMCIKCGRMESEN
jgi:hypothetical protein